MRERILFALGAACAMACAPAALARSPQLVVDAYLLGRAPERVAMLDRLPTRRSEVTVTTGRNSAGRALSYRVTVSGGVATADLPAILATLLIDRPRWHVYEPWQIRVHGNDELVRVVFHYPQLPPPCDQQWLVTRTRSGWMRLDADDPRTPNCVSVTQPPMPEPAVEY